MPEVHISGYDALMFAFQNRHTATYFPNAYQRYYTRQSIPQPIALNVQYIALPIGQGSQAKIQTSVI